MLVEELPIPDFVKKNVRELSINELYPPQVKAIQAGILEGENVILATPTASGKTLVSLLAASLHLIRGGKVLYLVPLKALASEKIEDCKRILCRNSGFRAAISTGDYDSSDPWLVDYDVIVATNEKADSLLRHKAPWMEDLSMVILDELHLLGDPDRGPTLEMIVTKLKRRLPGAQLVGLSATISNAEEIAGWLGARPVVSEWRPVPLREGVLMGRKIEFVDGEIKELRKIDENVLVNAVLNMVLDGGQVLAFAMTRAKAEQYAVKLAKAFDERIEVLDKNDRDLLIDYAEKIVEVDRSSFSENLARLVAAGVSFHHAGLSLAHRAIIEDAFKSRVLKVIVATPTLAAGVNLPARLVLITDTKRYQLGYGYQPIPVLEYKQFCGRAGRPGFDDIGYAITIARRKIDRDYIFEKYVLGQPEKIKSELASERHLRAHILAIVASEDLEKIDEVVKFFDSTFLAHIYGSFAIQGLIMDVLEFLRGAGLVEVMDRNVVATALGKRVSQLYIDPLTAVKLLEMFREAFRISVFGLLHAIALTPDVPMIPMKKLTHRLLEEELEMRREGLMVQPPDPVEDGYEEYMDAFRIALVLEAWINEVPEAEIYDKFGVQPGDLAMLRENASWIAYAASQIAKVAGYNEFIKPYDVLSIRLKHGIREELLPLVSLRGIGRVRARALYQAGFTDLQALREASLEDLMRVPGIGPSIAKSIKEQLQA